MVRVGTVCANSNHNRRGTANEEGIGIVREGHNIRYSVWQRTAVASLCVAALIAVLAGGKTSDFRYEVHAFAIPAHDDTLTPWHEDVGVFADRVTRAFGVRHSTAHEFSGWILEASERQEFEPELIASLVLTESSFRKSVRSHVGALGPAQIRPEFWSGFCGAADLTDPEENIYCGAQVLAYLRDLCGDNTCALKAYNVGRYSRKHDAAKRYVAKIDQHVESLQAL